jgi:dihydrodiol dehydrogenase / D-xylose 1-dehydrogenase (NADP)
MSNKQIRWGIASAGLISHDFANVITSLVPSEEQTIVAVAARHQKSADDFAKTFGIPKVGLKF